MDTGTIFLLVVVALLGLAFLFLFATARRRDTDRALEGLPDEEIEPEQVSVAPGPDPPGWSRFFP